MVSLGHRGTEWTSAFTRHACLAQCLITLVQAACLGVWILGLTQHPVHCLLTCRWLLQRSVQEYQHQAAQQTIVIKPCDDPALARLRGIRHTILARPSLPDLVAEMWGRGLEHSKALSQMHGHLLPPPGLQAAGIVESLPERHGAAVGAAAQSSLLHGQGGSPASPLVTAWQGAVPPSAVGSPSTATFSWRS